MAATDFPVGHTLAVKLWSKRIAREALKQTFAMKFAGEGSNNMIQIFDDTSKGPGDQIRWPLRVQPTGRGVTGSQSLEGNEEAIVTYADTFVIEELAHAFRAKTTIDAQRVAFDVREECRMSASDWLADRLEIRALAA